MNPEEDPFKHCDFQRRFGPPTYNDNAMPEFMPAIRFSSVPIRRITVTLGLVLLVSSVAAQDEASLKWAMCVVRKPGSAVTAQAVASAARNSEVQIRPAAADTAQSGYDYEATQVAAPAPRNSEARMRPAVAYAAQSGYDYEAMQVAAPAPRNSEAPMRPAAPGAVQSGYDSGAVRPISPAARTNEVQTRPVAAGPVQSSDEPVQTAAPADKASKAKARTAVTGAVQSGDETTPAAAPAGKASKAKNRPAVADADPPGDEATQVVAPAARNGKVKPSPAATDAVQSDDETIVIALGELKTLPMGGKITRIAVGNGKVVSTTTVENRLLLIAEQIGKTQVMVWSSQGTRTLRVQVVHPQLAAARGLLEEIVNHNNGLKLREVDSRLVVTGIAHTPVIEQLQKVAADLPGILLNVQPDQGSAATKSVLFRLHFIEVRKSLLENIGVQWGPYMSGPVFGVQGSQRSGIYRNVPPVRANANLLEDGRPFYSVDGRNTGAFFGIAASLASRINLGVADGDVRVLASPELTAKSGGQAKLQVGGEVPIPMAGAFGSVSVEFKPYGVLFNIAPTVDMDGTVTAKLSTELSQIDPSVTVQGIPGFLTRTTSTEISVKAGEVFVLSGLLSGDLSNSIDKVPGLGNIPILGRLFSSDDYRNQRTDLVVLVETEIINSGTGMAGEIMQRGQRSMQEFRELSQQRTSSGGRRPLERSREAVAPVTEHGKGY